MKPIRHFHYLVDLAGFGKYGHSLAEWLLSE